MPYSDLPPHAFWKLCRDAGDFRVGEIYEPKFALEPGMKLATAGSCFAQNIGRYIRASDLELVDVEPAPRAMPQGRSAPIICASIWKQATRSGAMRSSSSNSSATSSTTLSNMARPMHLWR